MKRKGAFKSLIAVLAAAALTACNNPSIEGTWLEPVPGMPGIKQGITFEAGGKAASVNRTTLKYEAWERKGNLLILSGKSIGNRHTLSFTDTMEIERLTRDSLILRERQLTHSYFRADKEQDNETIPASVITPAKKILSVKGKLEIGHEVRSFTAEGDTASYWIVDKTGQLIPKYDEATKGTKNGLPVYVELEVVDMGKSGEGFAAGYTGVYQVTKINKLSAE